METKDDEEHGTNRASNGDAITSETPSVISKDEDSVVCTNIKYINSCFKSLSVIFT